MRLGLDRWLDAGFRELEGQTIGIACNQATVSRDYIPILDAMRPFVEAGRFSIGAAFGPQHGIYGHTQDNMIEWEGENQGPFPIHSLYGAVRKPTPEMLQGLDRVVIDIPDVGSRYYTFVWTMALIMEACAELGIPVTVLDRPNPIGGVQREGPVLDLKFRSFVGLYPVPTRHGLTAGEIARLVQTHYLPSCDLQVVAVEGWNRADYLDTTDAPWVMPSPNMPTVDTAVVYPGACLLEGTNLSEGRGTTRPFEMFGAPFLNGAALAEQLNRLKLPGCWFRPVQFEPTFNKHSGRICEGCFVHVLARTHFEPVLTYVAALQEVIRQTGLADTSQLSKDPVFRAESEETALPSFAWRLPPYEYEYELQPIDILAGNDWLRPMIDGLSPLSEIRERMRAECDAFDTSDLPGESE